MFSFLKRRKKSSIWGDDPLERVENIVRHLGYDLLPYGIGVAKLELESGYREMEIASHIALTTLALDIRESGNDIERFGALALHGKSICRVLNEANKNKMMNPNQWQSDVNAVVKISIPSEEQLQWIDKVLSDPIAGKQRLAKSQIDYSSLVGSHPADEA